MREHPILFSAPMVRAILEGSKTQTRRVVRKQFAADAIVAEVAATTPEGWQISGHSGLWWDDAGACLDDAVRCPYGMPGDLLWVREHWRAPASCDHLPPRSISDSEPLRFIADETTGPDAGFGKARRAFHMPRWASRVSLEVTGVRVERLQDISVSDSIAEGLGEYASHLRGLSPCLEWRYAYEDLWTEINGPESWAVNPWVWVIEFRRF